jgi:predicted AAA+ superfamily ATPase
MGKTTWLREHFGDALWVDLLDETLYHELLADPGIFRSLLRRAKGQQWIVVDEVQRLPNLLNEVHRHMESEGNRFALTGSSARKLRRGGVNLLGGRASRHIMYPLQPSELAGDFVLERVLTTGSIPLVWSSPDPSETLKAYVQLYLKEEIQAEAVVRNLPGFARFLPVSALFHGQVLNISALARDAGVARTTVQGYLEILEDTLMAVRLPAFEGGLRVREKRHPKLYWIDPGLVRALKRARGPLVPEERGPLFEGLVCMLLCAYRDYKDAFDELYYWGPSQSPRLEVDFLVERGAERVAIEVKAVNRLRNDHFKGLRDIDGLSGLRRRVLVYTGDRSLQTDDGIDVLDFATFNEEIASNQLFPPARELG